MKINELNQKPGIENNVKLKETYIQFEKLLSELRKRDLPDKLVMSINKDVEEMNSTSMLGDDMGKRMKRKQTMIIKLLEKEVDIHFEPILR